MTPHGWGGAEPHLQLRTGDSTGGQEAPAGLRGHQRRHCELHIHLGGGCWQKPLCSLTVGAAPPSWGPTMKTKEEETWGSPPPFWERRVKHFQAQDTLEEGRVSVTVPLSGSRGKRGTEMAASSGRVKNRHGVCSPKMGEERDSCQDQGK